MAQQVLTGAISQSDFYGAVNDKYSQIDKISLANKVLKGATNISEAIVDVFGTTGIAGFKFHIPQSEQTRLESEITDYYTDLNNPIQDHIVRKPLIITMTGLMGEYFYSVNELSDMLAKVVPTLALVKQFLPKLSDFTKQTLQKKYSQRAMDNINLNFNLSNQTLTKSVLTGIINTQTTTASSLLNRLEFNALDLWKEFQNLYKIKSPQTRAYLFFDALWKAQASFSIETTWKRYDDMVLQSVVPNRDNLADVTEFQATFKQVNRVQSKTEFIDAAAGRLKEQAATVSNKGVDQGQEVKNV